MQVHAEILRANPDRKLVVAGHCDQRGTREYNLALGERRAKAIRAILEANGASSRQIEDISYGEEELANPANNARAWAQNRRADLLPLRSTLDTHMGIRARIGISFEHLFAPRNVAFSVVSCSALMGLISASVVIAAVPVEDSLLRAAAELDGKRMG